ncbi:MAG: primosomal protein N', partial [Erysipelotrichaceae bacterium]|nr:primosomal protein N' [Erysipelotrichaceae bacterium]
MSYIDVWVEHPLGLDAPLTYRCPFEHVEKGMRVTVSLNRQAVVGIVSDVDVKVPEGVDVKDVLSVLDDEPVINEELNQLALWMAMDTICDPILCYKTILPPVLKPQSSTQKAKSEKWLIAIAGEFELTSKQREIYEEILSLGEVLYSNIKSVSIRDKLIEKGAFRIEIREVSYTRSSKQGISSSLTLSEAQQKVVEGIDLDSHSVNLVFGATGSGKTEIYMRIADKVLTSGKQVILLVPEISLTPQMLDRFYKRFGDDIIVYHSHLTPQQRYIQYMRAKNQEASIAIGTRSAIFLPFENLGCIILDEEHDGSFKQDKAPFYHARDIAIHRGETFGCPVILGSATPAMETYARALKGVYRLFTLNQRITSAMAQVTLVDTRQLLRQRKNSELSEVLLEAIKLRINLGQQVILLLNRRGYMPILTCKQCGSVATCPNCDVSLAYHKAGQKATCHVCGYTQSKLVCTECGSTQWQGSGFATQRLEEQLKSHFPSARILRMDADTTRKMDGHATLLNAFAKGEADILLGTQMIAKGLDIPNVTLVGILQGDAAMGRPDYRSIENTFAMMVQAAGRSGRSSLGGEVIIQAFDVRHYAVQYARNQDYVSFFNHEMKYRHQGQYPPYTYLIAITVSDENWDKARGFGVDIALKCRSDESFKTLGPADLGRIK